MKILFLTWKDINHPNRWWAEKVVYEYTKWLVKKWHEVTWFWYAFKGGYETEVIDSIKIIRKFNPYTSLLLFPIYYKNNLAWKYDLIIDEAGWLPFLSPKFEKNIPIILFSHHIWDKEWDFIYPFPLNKIWKQVYYRMFKQYKNNKVITVSYSTKEDLINNFWFDEKNIRVIENALDIAPLKNIDFDNKKNSILFIGRLMPIKRVEDCIKAFSEFCKTNKSYKLNVVWIEQDKKYVEELKSLVTLLNIKNKVNFVWYDPSILEKYLIISKVLLVTSYKEWFWLIVLEWNAYWLPVIWYNVAWLKDSIKDWINGFLVKDWDYVTMWKKIGELLSDSGTYKIMSIKSLEYVKNLETRDKKVSDLNEFILNLNK